MGDAMLDFNLEYYRAFYYVAKLKNMTKAADALYLSQPAVSRSIHKLEEQLGGELFLRTPKGMALTPAGEKLFAHVSAAFDRLVIGEQEVHALWEHSAGTIKIAATETPLYHFLLPKIEGFKRLHPQVYFHVSGSSSGETISALRDGMADLAFAVSPVAPAGDLNILEGASFRDIFVAGSEYTHLNGRTLSTRELCKYPLITVERGTSARSLIDAWFEEQGAFFEPAYSVRTSTTVLPFVERNLGIGILPTLFAEKVIEEGRIFEVKSERPLYTRKILIIHRKDAPLSVLCKQFLSHVLQA